SPSVGGRAGVQPPPRPAPGLPPPVLAVAAVGPPPSLHPPPADHVGHLVAPVPPHEGGGHPGVPLNPHLLVVPLGHGRPAPIPLPPSSRTYVREEGDSTPG